MDAIYPINRAHLITLCPHWQTHPARTSSRSRLKRRCWPTVCRQPRSATRLKDAQRRSTAFLYRCLRRSCSGHSALDRVGVAAMSGIAFRLVVERRRRMGRLRATILSARSVTLSFMIETGFVVAIGVLSGTVLGLMLARNLFQDEDFSASAGTFKVPWTILVVIVIATITSALVMAWVPSRRAARIAQAERAATRVETRRFGVVSQESVD